MALSETGESLSAGARDDAGEYLPKAGAEIPGVPEMPGIGEREDALSFGEYSLDQRF